MDCPVKCMMSIVSDDFQSIANNFANKEAYYGSLDKSTLSQVNEGIQGQFEAFQDQVKSTS